MEENNCIKENHTKENNSYMEDFILKHWDNPSLVEKEYSNFSSLTEKNNNLLGYFCLTGINNFNKDTCTAYRYIYDAVKKDKNLKFLTKIISYFVDPDPEPNSTEESACERSNYAYYLWYDLHLLKIKEDLENTCSSFILDYIYCSPLINNKDEELEFLNIIVEKNDEYKGEAFYRIAQILYRNENENKENYIEIFKKSAELLYSPAYYRLYEIPSHLSNLSKKERESYLIKGHELGNKDCTEEYIELLYASLYETGNENDLCKAISLYEKTDLFKKDDIYRDKPSCGFYAIPRIIWNFISKKLKENEKLQEENEKLKRENEDLKDAFELHPDGSFANNLINNVNNNYQKIKKIT